MPKQGMLVAAVQASPQVRPEDMPSIVASGFTILVNHRPEDEELGQPTGESVAAAARAAGLSYYAIPVHGLPDSVAVEMTLAVLLAMGPEDRALMFCRSGMRSTAAWAMAEVRRGGEPDRLRATAAAAGYDISRVPL